MMVFVESSKKASNNVIILKDFTTLRFLNESLRALILKRYRMSTEILKILHTLINE